MKNKAAQEDEEASRSLLAEPSWFDGANTRRVRPLFSGRDGDIAFVADRMEWVSPLSSSFFSSLMTSSSSSSSPSYRSCAKRSSHGLPHRVLTRAHMCV